MAFYVGQKVECIDDSSFEGTISTAVKGDVYTVLGFYHSVFQPGRIGLLFHEIEPPTHYMAFNARRFRPLTSRPTSISIFTAMLGPKQKETIDG